VFYIRLLCPHGPTVLDKVMTLFSGRFMLIMYIQGLRQNSCTGSKWTVYTAAVQ